MEIKSTEQTKASPTGAWCACLLTDCDVSESVE